jgi:hypothetical protein
MITQSNFKNEAYNSGLGMQLSGSILAYYLIPGLIQGFLPVYLQL